MANFFPPPPPFIGGAQPYAPHAGTPAGVPVNNPPFSFGGPVASLAEVVQQAQPPAWPYVFFGQAQPYDGPEMLSPALSAAVINNPPFTYGGPIANVAAIVSQAQPNPWVYVYTGAWSGLQPYGAPQANPSITAVEVDNPPFTYGGPIASLAAIVQQTQPTIWPFAFIGGAQPYAPFVMGGPTGRQDNPPFKFGGPIANVAAIVSQAQPNPWVYGYQGAVTGRQPYGASQLPPSVVAVRVDNPPPNRQDLTVILNAWAVQNLLQQPYKQKISVRSSSYGKGYIIG